MSIKLKAVTGGSTHHVRMWIIDGSGRKLHPPYFFSKGRKDIPLFAAEKIRKALLLDKAEFKMLVECDMGREQYLTIRVTRDAGGIVSVEQDESK